MGTGVGLEHGGENGEVRVDWGGDAEGDRGVGEGDSREVGGGEVREVDGVSAGLEEGRKGLWRGGLRVNKGEEM